MYTPLYTWLHTTTPARSLLDVMTTQRSVHPLDKVTTVSLKVTHAHSTSALNVSMNASRVMTGRRRCFLLRRIGLDVIIISDDTDASHHQHFRSPLQLIMSSSTQHHAASHVAPLDRTVTHSHTLVQALAHTRTNISSSSGQCNMGVTCTALCTQHR